MQQFFQAIGAVMLAVILILVLKQGNPSIGGLLSILTCAMVMIWTVSQLNAVADFIRTLEQIAHFDNTMLKQIIKITGISVIAEITTLICGDSGNHALGKALQLLATAVIICLSIPMMTGFLQLIEGILKEL